MEGSHKKSLIVGVALVSVGLVMVILGIVTRDSDSPPAKSDLRTSISPRLTDTDDDRDLTDNEWDYVYAVMNLAPANISPRRLANLGYSACDLLRNGDQHVENYLYRKFGVMGDVAIAIHVKAPDYLCPGVK
ncbi:hypothetical protein [Rhodococcus sp. T2V]|uniref:hypothetical protein n=1 Tax=Rhodococcus sp. T2V TaxID=3034164 RepID=UPI0023E1D5FF|nr:hypothetical protein [Rhodococcus sp. T2V]